MFKALLLEEADAGFSARVQTCAEKETAGGEALVQVEHSRLDYKDGATT